MLISITDEKLGENISVIEISVMRQFQNVKYNKIVDYQHVDVDAKDERKQLDESEENSRGGEENVENIEAKFFIQVWGKNHCTKNELNLLSKNSIVKYDVILN